MSDEIPEADATPDEAYEIGAVNGHNEGYSAGRASRDAEVAELESDLKFKRRSNARLGRDYVEAERSRQEAIVRAERAEAILLRVRRLLGSEELGLRTYGISAEDLREALSGEHTPKA